MVRNHINVETEQITSPVVAKDIKIPRIYTEKNIIRSTMLMADMGDRDIKREWSDHKKKRKRFMTDIPCQQVAVKSDKGVYGSKTFVLDGKEAEVLKQLHEFKNIRVKYLQFIWEKLLGVLTKICDPYSYVTGYGTIDDWIAY